MKRPMRRGAAVTRKRLAEWDSRFRYYRAPPDVSAITAWLSRFKQSDLDTAARLLDVVEVVPEAQIQRGYRESLLTIPGWSSTAANRNGRWLFVGFGGAGESGSAMARTFREATRMAAGKYDYLFCSAAELPAKGLKAADTVVFVDDFSGTGAQVCSVWPTIEELIASEARCFLILTAATRIALKRIEECSRLVVRVSIELEESEDVFSSHCRYFSGDEKETLLEYCLKADKKRPKGFGECGLLYVLSHKTPNNSIPLLHANNKNWVGLFPRYLNPE